MLEKGFGGKCCSEVLSRTVGEMRWRELLLEKSVVETCWRKVME